MAAQRTSDNRSVIAAFAPGVAAPQVGYRGGTPSATGTQSVEEMAAELDAAVAQEVAGDVDPMLLRVEQTDLPTHATYAEVNRTGPDGGRGDTRRLALRRASRR